MSISTFQAAAAEASARLTGAHESGESFRQLAARFAGRSAVADDTGVQAEHDAEWQRVNSYIADVLKDTHVLYAKLARLQGDFVGEELMELEKISSSVLDLGEQLSVFMKRFHNGDASMMKEKQFGGQSGAPAGTPPPAIPSEFKRPEEDFETELDLEGEGDDFEGFDEKSGSEGGEEQQQQQQQ